MRWGGAAALVLATAACGPRARPAVTVVELDDGWRFHGTSDTTWLPARVPGTVHTDLLAAGRIPEPLVGVVENDLQWIEGETWSYRLDFDVDRRLLEEDRVELVFDGLDTYASVTLNGTPVLEADNMFRTWRVDAGGALQAGSNTLEIRFDPAVERGARRAEAHPWPIPHQEPDVSATRAFTRKAAYQYGWDWGPRYVTAGIWRPVRLEAWSGARITDAYVTDVEAGPDTLEAVLVVELDVADPGPVRLGIRSGNDAFDVSLEEVDITAPGRTTVATRLAFPGGELWWPRGSGGGRPHLYDVDIDVVRERRWDRLATRVGLRTVALDTTPDAGGSAFRFVVNGAPVFARGANVIPLDHFTPRADSATYARLLDDAVAANMNMVRVWGGGVYMPDVFYDLADERGLLVWQDFMFANTLVPGDSSFVASVAAEAGDQVRRLRRHPSLALWCGNNEVAEGWANWGWRAEYADDVALEVDAAYRRVFEDVLPAAVGEGDAGVPYWPSSPSIGWGHPESLTSGDSHYWGVWWGMEPFRVYADKVPRFASEFGFQALPDPATLATFGGSPGDGGPGSLDDEGMRAHQKHATGYETIRAYVERDWPVPPDDSLDAWSYVSQLAQAEGVGLALEAHRRSWPRTGGTLYWQLNDTWPVVSWSSRDHSERRKALQYRAADVFAPVAVLADRWADTVAVWVASDAPVVGALRVRLRTLSGDVLFEDSVPVSGAGLAWRANVADVLPGGSDPRTVFVESLLETASSPETGDVAFLVSPGALTLADPGVRVAAAEPDGSAWRVALTADRFAFAVRVRLDGADARFSRNYVHIVPGDTVLLRVTPSAPLPDLPARLRLRSLWDVPR
ncbi:MAG TPA: glycoside hydrolase family 2 protein [Longimicrobiales bacterium]|nr:glycoside hydrolase family 2 protein [Longimicrobiales bacterium]